MKITTFTKENKKHVMLSDGMYDSFLGFRIREKGVDLKVRTEIKVSVSYGIATQIPISAPVSCLPMSRRNSTHLLHPSLTPSLTSLTTPRLLPNG